MLAATPWIIGISCAVIVFVDYGCGEIFYTSLLASAKIEMSAIITRKCQIDRLYKVKIFSIVISKMATAPLLLIFIFQSEFSKVMFCNPERPPSSDFNDLHFSYTGEINFKVKLQIKPFFISHLLGLC